PVGHRLWDTRGATADSVLAPHFGQEEFAIQQTVERPVGQGQVNRDDAVVDLAGGAAILALDARGLVTLLRASRLVEDADDAGAAMSGGDDPLESIPHQEVVPLGQAQELLQGLGRDVGGYRDRLDALPRQVRELPLHISGQVRSGSIMREAIIEASEELANSRAGADNLVGRHGRMSPYKAFPTKSSPPLATSSILR